MIVSIIVAVDNNFGIGKNNDLLWHLPNDMKYFKETTLNHHIITGRKNYLSIPKKYRPLINRTNIVLTRNKRLDFDDDCIVKNNLEDAISFAKMNGEKEVFIIGGGQIYKEAIDKNLVDRLYITHVDAELDADVFFPKFNEDKWIKKTLKKNHKDVSHLYDFSLIVYDKKPTTY